jgi:hypothetical protein
MCRPRPPSWSASPQHGATGLGPSTPDRLAYLQAKFDRRVSDPASRDAAATLIKEWRERATDSVPKPDRTAPQSNGPTAN